MNQPSGLAALLRELAGSSKHDPHDGTVRLTIRLRAKDCCEYCLLPTTSQFHIDHVIPPSLWDDYVAGSLPAVQYRPGRRGPDHLDNFAWCCPFCNIAKRQQVALKIGRRSFRIFDPRHDRWSDHFIFVHNYLFIVGFSGIGQATERALGFNSQRLNGPLGTRHDATLVGQYPPIWARSWLATSET